MRFGNSSCASISGPIAARSRSSSSSPTSIAHCGLPIETCWNAHSRPPAIERPGAVLATRREVLRGGRGPAHLDRAGQLRGDRRHDRPGGGADREGVLVGPAVAAQVEDRLPRAVARQLRLGAVGVEDPQIGDEARVLAPREQQDRRRRRPRSAGRRATRSAPRSAPREAAPPRRSSNRSRAPATSRTSRGAAYSPRTATISAATSASSRPVRSIGAHARHLAHPGQLAAGVVARALLHPLDVAAEQLVEAKRLSRGPRGPSRFGTPHLLLRPAGDDRLGPSIDPLVELGPVHVQPEDRRSGDGSQPTTARSPRPRAAP